ncbi:hypothetical protein [Streptomyces sp. XD-27]|uniref:hypothetical protein n=1 Tax=Streptomyces sp. XD-27 TaxID=3062779 RepID=UPI0026F42A3F|nr:hypothetical protein [Streptomyces sp. XD-27]WKX73732.1 hypothetical protein Q3Y56_31105 [Streptomyces sp. XD-27]
MKEEERRVPPTARIAEFPKKAADQARWWESHILEVLHGLPPDAPQGAVPRPEFDPRLHSLAERERAKAAELTAAGHRMTASGVKQRRHRYRRDGLVGLADGRSAKQLPPFGRIAPAVVEAMRQAIDETADASSRTIGFIIWRTKQIVASHEDGDGIELPTDRTLYRLFDKLAVGTHATGSATTRRSVHARPAGPFGEVPAVAPGELMQIDSSPLDVLVRLDDGIAEKVELTALVDIASRSITAAVLHVSRIWVRDRRGDRDRWITVFWRHLHRVGVPFGEMAWAHAHQQAPRNVGEAQIADVAVGLLQRAHDGPRDEQDAPAKRSQRDRRIAARTRATAPSREDPDPPPADSEPADEDTDTSTAKVIPLGLFDPLANPWRRP